jgi:hypothetical protein
MNYQDVIEVREQAQRDIEVADLAVRQAVKLVIGRLKSSRVQGSHLSELKRELKDFNMHTWCWK